VFLLEKHVASKSLAAVREVFNCAYPDREVPNKAAIYELVIIFLDIRSVCDGKHVRRRRVLKSEELRSFEGTLKNNSSVSLY
jgi:hypothetical protein